MYMAFTETSILAFVECSCNPWKGKRCNHWEDYFFIADEETDDVSNIDSQMDAMWDVKTLVQSTRPK